MSAARNYVRLEHVAMLGHPDVDERLLMARILEDPGVLGLGDLVVDEARTRSSRGRLELTLYKPDANRHYLIALQLGAADERHLIRAVEHWAAERQHAPGSGHYAIFIAEEIPPRFLRPIVKPGHSADCSPDGCRPDRRRPRPSVHNTDPCNGWLGIPLAQPRGPQQFLDILDEPCRGNVQRRRQAEHRP